MGTDQRAEERTGNVVDSAINDDVHAVLLVLMLGDLGGGECLRHDCDAGVVFVGLRNESRVVLLAVLPLRDQSIVRRG